jgi:IclR family transcriptional regulator, acetate operon repressor
MTYPSRLFVSKRLGSVLLLQPGSAVVRRLVTLPKGSGRLSGLATDSAGGIWTTLRDGWSVMRLSSDGGLERVVGLPVPCPTDLTLVGATLYITTSRQPVSLDALEKSPLSGRILRIQA